MSENFNIDNKKIQKESEQEKVKLSEKERKEFKNEFDLINSLIEDHLKETETEQSLETSNDFVKEDDDSLAIKQSYNDPAKINQERLQRIGLLKSDPTGKNIKASGEDI